MDPWHTKLASLTQCIPGTPCIPATPSVHCSPQGYYCPGGAPTAAVNTATVPITIPPGDVTIRKCDKDAWTIELGASAAEQCCKFPRRQVSCPLASAAG